MFETYEEKLRSRSGDNTMSNTLYNAVMGSVVLYGILANIITCAYFTNYALSLNVTALCVAYMVLATVGILISVSKSPLISFLGYNLVVLPSGLILSVVIDEYGGLSSRVVMYAFAETLLITFAMVCFSIMFPNFFSKIGGFLFVGLVMLLILLVAQVFFFPNYEGKGIAWFGAGLFSLYIGYDFYKAQGYAKTLDNAIDSALDIYLDIINLFLKVLELLGKKK